MIGRTTICFLRLSVVVATTSAITTNTACGNETQPTKVDAAQQPWDATVSVDAEAIETGCIPSFPFAVPQRVTGPAGAAIHPFHVVSDPELLKEGGRYRMWFTSNNFVMGQSELGIAYAESDDGITFEDTYYTPGNGEQIALQIRPDGWDAEGSETASIVVSPEGDYLLFYTGDHAPEGLSYSIGLATSSDGINWAHPAMTSFEAELPWELPVCIDEPVCSNQFGGVLEPTVIYDQDMSLYRLWYAALGVLNGKMTYRMGYATSPDAQTWTRHPTPVFTPGESGAWDDELVSHFEVVKDNSGTLHMFYFGSSAQQVCVEPCGLTPGAIGYASSLDGINWTRHADNPIVSADGDTEPYMVGGPSAILDNNMLQLWYFDTETLNTANAFDLRLQSTSVPCGS